MSDSDDDAPPPALQMTGDFSTEGPPPRIEATGDFGTGPPLSRKDTAPIGGLARPTGIKLDSDGGPSSPRSMNGSELSRSPGSALSPAMMSSPQSSFRWNTHQSFRLFANHSKSMMFGSRRGSMLPGGNERSMSGNWDSLAGSMKDLGGASPLLPPGGDRDIKKEIRTAQSQLKNFISLNGEVAKNSSLESHVRKGKLIGSGGYADVYSGINTQSGQLVAIKEMKVGDRSKPEDFRDIQDEFSLLRTFKHENVVRYLLFEYSVNAGLCRIVMEFCPGGSTQSLMQKFGPLPEAILKKFALDMCKALTFIHSEGITHRDIKPANILVNAEGTVKLADFGCSRKINEINETTKNLIGTPVYMAPEFIKGQLHVKSDVWSIGCTLVELATGKQPWCHTKIRDHLQLMFHITTSSDSPRPLDDSSPEFSDFLEKCFTRDPFKRPSASELLNHPFITMELEDDTEGRLAIEEIACDQCVSVCATLTAQELGADVLDSPDNSPRSHPLTPPSSGLMSGDMGPPIGSNQNSGSVEVEKPQYLAISEGKEGGLELATVIDNDETPGSPADPFAGVKMPPVLADPARRAELQAARKSDVEHSLISDGSMTPPEGSLVGAPPGLAAPRLSLNGPLKMNYSFSTGGGRKINVGLDIDPADVSMKMIDKRQSFVVAMSDNLKGQLSKAMTDLQRDEAENSMGPMLESPRSNSPSVSPYASPHKDDMAFSESLGVVPQMSINPATPTEHRVEAPGSAESPTAQLDSPTSSPSDPPLEREGTTANAS